MLLITNYESTKNLNSMSALTSLILINYKLISFDNFAYSYTIRLIF